MIVTKIFMGALRVARGTALALGVGVMLALVLGVAATALAGTGVGATFNLGQANTVNKISSLIGSASSAMLKIDNNDTGPALNLQVEPNRPPLTVNSGAGKATNLNADKLDGKDESAFLGKAETAADSQMLDGQDSSEFVQGNGRVMDGAVELIPGGLSELIAHNNRSPNIDVEYECPSDPTTNGTLTVWAEGTEPLILFSDNGGSNPNVITQLIPGVDVDEEGNPEPDWYSQPAAASGEHITLQVLGAGMATIEVFSGHGGSGCSVQAQGLFSY